MEEMHGLKDIKRNEFFVSGHGACPGCGIAIAIKNVMRILGPDATVYVPASCAVVKVTLPLVDVIRQNQFLWVQNQGGIIIFND